MTAKSERRGPEDGPPTPFPHTQESSEHGDGQETTGMGTDDHHAAPVNLCGR